MMIITMIMIMITITVTITIMMMIMVMMMMMIIIASFRLDYEYEIEYECDFSILGFTLSRHISTSFHEAPALPKTNMKNKGFGNLTGLKCENRTRTQSRTRSPI